MKNCWLVFLLFLWGCSTKPKLSEKDHAVKQCSSDIAQWILENHLDSALEKTNQLRNSKNNDERELGTYWKAIYLLEKSEKDSAQVILESYNNRWSNPLREVHAKAILRLLDQIKKANTRPRNIDPTNAMQEKLDQLENQTGELRNMILQLQLDKKKYEKVLKELEKIR